MNELEEHPCATCGRSPQAWKAPQRSCAAQGAVSERPRLPNRRANETFRLEHAGTKYTVTRRLIHESLRRRV
jgi:hypothetical protein